MTQHTLLFIAASTFQTLLSEGIDSLGKDIVVVYTWAEYVFDLISTYCVLIMLLDMHDIVFVFTIIKFDDLFINKLVIYLHLFNVSCLFLLVSQSDGDKKKTKGKDSLVPTPFTSKIATLKVLQKLKTHKKYKCFLNLKIIFFFTALQQRAGGRV